MCVCKTTSAQPFLKPLAKPDLDFMHIILVGCGKMGGALQKRWQDISLYQKICIVEPYGDFDAKSSADIPADFKPDVIVFAVKPQSLADITGDYQKYVDALFISIAAGKLVSFFETHLGNNAKIIRTMPNTPASIGKGMTVAYANQNVTAAEKDIATKMLSAVGDVLWVDREELLNPVTALSGSGPAYVFLLIEAMTNAGISIGLDADMAAKLARQTVIGSAALAEMDADTPAAKLRENVTSPNGTTAAALDVLMAAGGMQELFNKALAAATKRAEELSR